MLSPFPGMNPYLEDPELWQKVHKRLIIAIADSLSPQLRPKYIVDIVIDYSKEPVSQLSEENAVWADTLLREKELR